MDSVSSARRHRLEASEAIQNVDNFGSQNCSNHRWWVKVGLVHQRPLQRIDLEQDLTYQSRSGTQELLFQGQITAGLQSGALPALTCLGGWIPLNGVADRGPLELKRFAQDCLAVHTVELERYVASVVGAEMPSPWHSQALQAQAIAARSYDLIHLIRPASARYHLGDSTRWQVCLPGASSRSAAADSAARATHGIILSKGQAVVESLYAATKDISEAVHQHLGASMSQYGARDLADQGLSHSDILRHYYPGPELKQLRRDDG